MIFWAMATEKAFNVGSLRRNFNGDQSNGHQIRTDFV